jgi:predicted PurR-regulated permease PerM
MKNFRANYGDLAVEFARKSPVFFFLAAVVLVIASLYLAQAILIPVAIFILLTFLLSPVADSLEQTGSGVSVFRRTHQDLCVFLLNRGRLDRLFEG